MTHPICLRQHALHDFTLIARQLLLPRQLPRVEPGGNVGSASPLQWGPSSSSWKLAGWFDAGATAVDNCDLLAFS